MTELLARKDPAGIKPSVREGIKRSAVAVTGPHVVTQLDLDHLIERTAREARSLVFGVQGGILDAKDFGDRMATLLEDAHGRASYLGRMKGGDQAAYDQDDRKFGEQVVDGEAEFLAHFQADLESGKYEGDWAKSEERADFYALRLTGTANEAMALAMPEDTVVHWILGETENHCTDCPAIAAGSPYTAATLPSHPGDCQTECLFRCLCALEYEGGKTGFTVPRSITR